MSWIISRFATSTIKVNDNEVRFLVDDDRIYIPTRNGDRLSIVVENITTEGLNVVGVYDCVEISSGTQWHPSINLSMDYLLPKRSLCISHWCKMPGRLLTARNVWSEAVPPETVTPETPGSIALELFKFDALVFRKNSINSEQVVVLPVLPHIYDTWKRDKRFGAKDVYELDLRPAAD